jgi:hypothetical protein
VFRDDNDTFAVEFLAGGRVRSHDDADTTPDNDGWAVQGGVLHWWFNDRYVEFIASFDSSDRMRGSAQNVRGLRWSFSATRGVVGSQPPPPRPQQPIASTCPGDAVALGGQCTSLVGTVWAYRDEDDEYQIEFLPGGRFHTMNPADTTPDNDQWAVQGGEVHWWYNDRYVEYVGRPQDGQTLAGDALNTVGKRWSWTARRVR